MGSPLWHWADVAAWFENKGGGKLPVEGRVHPIASNNGVLANRALARGAGKT